MPLAATKHFQSALTHDKLQYDSSLQQPLLKCALSVYVLVEQESALRNKERLETDRTRNKLALCTEGPLRVVAVESSTIKFERYQHKRLYLKGLRGEKSINGESKQDHSCARAYHAKKQIPQSSNRTFPIFEKCGRTNDCDSA